jgi:hypothetical protein
LVKDLAALTPPAVVCAAFLVGLVLLLRREMAPKHRMREDAGSERDISGNNGIIDAKAPASAAHPDEHDDAGRSPDDEAG